MAKEFAHHSVNHRRKQRTTDDECGSDALAQNSTILDLIAAAEKSETCSNVAVDVFQKHFAENVFVIDKNPSVYSSSYNLESSSIEETIPDLRAASALITHFGHSIKKLDILFNGREQSCEQRQLTEILNILKAIDSHCRESLVELELNYGGCNVNNVFNQIQGPYQHVEILSCNLYDMNQKTSDRDFQLNAVFPNIRQLQIYFRHLKEPSFVGCAFPKLEKLDISNGLSNGSSQPVLIELLRNNPQITSLSVRDPTGQALRTINKYLTHLEELNIDMKFQAKFNFGKTDENEEIRFSTVKRLRINRDECRLPSGISFDETVLREIALICHSGSYTDEYLDFLFKYSKIQKLETGLDLRAAILMKLAGKFPELSHAVIGLHEDVSADDITEFIKNTPKLQKLEFYKEDSEKIQTFVNELKLKLSAEHDTFGIKFINHEIPPLSTKALKHVFIERDSDNAAYLLQTTNHITVIMFVIVCASWFLFG